jgi:hypothetical protein
MDKYWHQIFYIVGMMSMISVPFLNGEYKTQTILTAIAFIQAAIYTKPR